jgi:hypothetical protein
VHSGVATGRFISYSFLARPRAGNNIPRVWRPGSGTLCAAGSCSPVAPVLALVFGGSTFPACGGIRVEGSSSSTSSSNGSSVQCPVGQDLVKYLANREKDRERSLSNPRCKRNNLVWCRQREDLNQEYIHNVLRGGGDGVPFTASPAVGIKNLHVMSSGKPLF